MATSQEDSTFKWLAERRQPLMMNSYPSFVKALPACLHGLEQYTVVGLGEGTHGTSEFQTVRTYITRYLVEEKGFRVICLENSYGGTYELNKHLQAGNADLDSLMHLYMLGIWQNEETRSMLTWIRQYNKSHRDKIVLTGMDFTDPDISTAALQRLNSGTGTDSLSSYSRYLMQAYRAFNRTDTTVERKEWLQKGVEGYELVMRIKVASDERKDTPAFRELLENLRMGFYSIYRPVKEGREASRDEQMAEMVRLISNDRQGSKMVVWAHNAHIAKAGIFDDDSNGGGSGVFLERFFPGKYFAIGTGTFGGTFSATRDRFVVNTSRFSSYKLNDAIKGSWEYMLQGNDACLDLKRKTPSAPNLLQRFIGYGPGNSEKNYVRIKLDKLFDAFLFIQTTQATKPL